MLSYDQSSDLLDATMATLEGDPTSTPPQSGIQLVDQWIAPLREGERTKEIADLLEQLKTQLGTDQPNPEELHHTFKDIATKTKLLSTEVGPEGDLFIRMEGLVTVLQQFSDKLLNPNMSSQL